MPELAQAVNASTAGDEINTTQWEDISIGALASHMAGIARMVRQPLSSSMSRKLTIVNLDGQTGLLSIALLWTSLRCPEFTASELPSCKFNSSVPSYTRASKPCKVYPLTDANEFVVFLQDLIKHQPIFPPSTTSIHSNSIHSNGALPLLCFVLESITNKSFTDMMNNLFTQLDFSPTTYTTPNSSA